VAKRGVRHGRGKFPVFPVETRNFADFPAFDCENSELDQSLAGEFP
jgi:hypothetical protein